MWTYVQSYGTLYGLLAYTTRSCKTFPPNDFQKYPRRRKNDTAGTWINLLGGFIPPALRDAAHRLAEWAHPVMYMADLYLLKLLTCLTKAHNRWIIIRYQGIRVCRIGYWKGRNVVNYIQAGGSWNVFLWIMIGLSTSVSFRTPKDKRKTASGRGPSRGRQTDTNRGRGKGSAWKSQQPSGLEVHQLEPLSQWLAILDPQATRT